MEPNQQPFQDFITGLQDFGIGATVGGGALQAIGTYYQVLNQQEQLKTRALSKDFESQVAEFNSSLMAQAAATALQATQQEVGISRMRAASDKATARASAAGRGVKVDSGSAAETEKAIELMSQVDAMTIEANGDRVVGDVRRKQTDLLNKSVFARVSASNVRSTANSLSPAGAYLTQSLANAGRVSSSFYRRFNS